MKYPRTYHLPFSPGAPEDKIIKDINTLLNVPVIITEKLDGSNVSIMSDKCFARSHANPPKHASFDMFKAFHAQVKHLIPLQVQLFGEWLYAKHSIEYENLPGYFLLFGVRNINTQMWTSWSSVEKIAEIIGVYTVPVISRNTVFSNEKELKNLIQHYYKFPSMYSKQREGFVIRHKNEFNNDNFQQCVAKWVRAEHNQIDEHWMRKEIVRNKLNENC